MTKKDMLAVKVDFQAIADVVVDKVKETFKDDWWCDEMGDAMANLIDDIMRDKEVKKAAKEMVLQKIKEA